MKNNSYMQEWEGVGESGNEWYFFKVWEDMRKTGKEWMGVGRRRWVQLNYEKNRV